MAFPTKIATCCYCGTRATLVLSGQGRQELACSACGAPLHNLKMLRKDKGNARSQADPAGVKGRPDSARARVHAAKPKKRKRRKSMLKWVLEEAFDVIEDVLD